MQPIFSYHSRADGTIHGITSVCQERSDLLVAAKRTRRAGAAVRAADRPMNEPVASPILELQSDQRFRGVPRQRTSISLSSRVKSTLSSERMALASRR
jgi:hypothetical protein